MPHPGLYEGKKSTLNNTGSPRYVCLYDLLVWVGISNFTAEHAHVDWSNHEVAFDTTPDTRKCMNLTEYTDSIWNKISVWLD